MFNVYDMMKCGMSADEIAAAFTQSLNDAVAKVEAEEAEVARLAEKAARAEEARQIAADTKRADFAHATCEFMRAIAKHYPELGVQEEDITEEGSAAIADLIIVLMDVEAMKNKHKVRVQVKTNDNKTVPVKEVMVDPFAEFFKKFGL